MRPSGSPLELEHRRWRAVGLLQQGVPPRWRLHVGWESIDDRCAAGGRATSAAERPRWSPSPSPVARPNWMPDPDADWKRICCGVPALAGSRPTCGLVLAWPSGFAAGSGFAIMSIISAACCTPWVGVPRSRNGAPGSPMSGPFDAGCGRAGPR